jgi:glyoxylate reductase/hydroxypyruvate reductase 2
MTYPHLEAQGLLNIVGGIAEGTALPLHDRQAIRVLMTSASRGCSADMIAALPTLGLVVSQGVGQDKIETAALTAHAQHG